MNPLNTYTKWKIGNEIRNNLIASTAITTQVGNHIYPIIAPENVTGDFIVYKRDKYGRKNVKIGYYEDDCYVMVVGISDNYDKAVSLAQEIDNVLSGEHTTATGIRYNVLLEDSSETFDENKYIETLMFQIK